MLAHFLLEYLIVTNSNRGYRQQTFSQLKVSQYIFARQQLTIKMENNPKTLSLNRTDPIDFKSQISPKKKQQRLSRFIVLINTT